MQFILILQFQRKACIDCFITNDTNSKLNKCVKVWKCRKEGKDGIENSKKSWTDIRAIRIVLGMFFFVYQLTTIGVFAMAIAMHRTLHEAKGRCLYHASQMLGSFRRQFWAWSVSSRDFLWFGFFLKLAIHIHQSV